jgi:hypothetical protein
MQTHATAAYGIYPRNVALTEIVRRLNQAGFHNEDICMMLSSAHPIASAVRDASVFNDEKQSDFGSAALIGWLSEFGAVLIPRVGFFIRSQAFFHALMTAREAPALCGKSRTLVGLGFSEQEAKRFEDKLEELGVLVYVSCSEDSKTAWAREVLRHTGAAEASTIAESLSAVAAIA